MKTLKLTPQELRYVMIALQLRAEAAEENQHLSRYDRARARRWRALYDKAHAELYGLGRRRRS